MDSWTEKKEAHKALSAAAAEKYDELYEVANFATGSYMRYEVEVIRNWVEQSPLPRHLALDLGCGTETPPSSLATLIRSLATTFQRR
jgi:hypothetical protein